MSGGTFNYESSFEESELIKASKKNLSKNLLEEEEKRIRKGSHDSTKKFGKINERFRTNYEGQGSFSSHSNINESFLEKIYENNESSEEDDSEIYVTYNHSDSMVKEGASRGKMRYSKNRRSYKRKISLK